MPNDRLLTEVTVDTITATATSTTDPTRRVRLTLGLRDRATGDSFLSHAPSYACSVAPADDLAKTFRPANWESGIVSGAGFAVRRWLGDRQGLLLLELDGRLGGDGIEAIALATANALAALVGKDSPPPAPGWYVQAQSGLANGQDGFHAQSAAERSGA
jgi:hypothetical protein